MQAVTDNTAVHEAYPVRGLARATVVGIVVVLAIGLVEKTFNWYALDLVRQAQERLDVRLIDEAGPWWQSSGLFWLQNLALATTVVIALSWCFQARRNLTAIPGAAPRFRPLWTVLGWFVPGVNLVLPALAVEDLATGSAPSDRRLRVLVWIWWVTLVAAEGGALLYALLGAAPERPPADFRGPEGFQLWVNYFEGSFYGTLLFFVLSVAAGGLFAILVTRISRAQHARLPELDGTKKPTRKR